MFAHAVEAGAAVAATWTPECPEPAGGGGCCPLCFGRYRMLVLDGPLQGLPHGVAHAVVATVDERIRARVSASCDLGETARRAEAAGGLLVVALEEFGAAEARLAELRRRCTEPALEHWLAMHPVEEVPDAWL
jgi:hypothetical protein